MSCAVSRTWPTVRWYRANAELQELTRATWPTLAAACLVAKSVGRRVNPSGSRPAAIAPEDTITTSDPAFIRVSIASASFSSRPTSNMPVFEVNAVVPTFTTTLRAVRTASRGGDIAVMAHPQADAHRNGRDARGGPPSAR